MAIQLAFGTLAFRQKDVAAAEAAFKQAIALDPKAGAPHVALARVYWSQNNLELADQEYRAAVSLPDAKPATRLQWAEFKLKTRRVEEAKKILEELTASSPTFAPAWANLAEIALLEKRYDDGLKLAGAALLRDPANFDALMLHARLKLAQNKPQEALQEFERLSRQFPRSPELQYQLAVAQVVNKDIAGAVSALNQVMALDTNHTEAILLLASLDLRRGDPANAVSSIAQLLKRQPDNPRAYYVLADAYLAQSRWDEAAAVYRQVTGRFTKDAQAPFRLGLVLLRKKDLAEARKAFEKALELEPGFLPATAQLVGLDIDEKNFPAALARAQAQVQKHTNSAAALLLLANVYRAQEMPEPAEAALKKAILQDGNYVPAYLALAQLYFKAGKDREALHNLSSVVQKNPNDFQAFLLMGMIHERTKNYSEARDAYDRSLKANPVFGPALNNLAYLYAEQFKQPDKGYEYGLKARQLYPNDPNIADTLGWILFHRGEYAEAINLFQESADELRSRGRVESQSEVQYHLGMAHYMMGQEEPARLVFQRALMDPDFPSRDKVEQRLAVLNLRIAPVWVMFRDGSVRPKQRREVTKGH
jgi:Tfp pilus assembly protein PilF